MGNNRIEICRTASKLRDWAQTSASPDVERIDNARSTQYEATALVLVLTTQPPSWSQPSTFEFYFPSHPDSNPTISECKEGRLQALPPVKILEIGKHVIQNYA